MLDIRFIRENPEIVKENIKKKFQEEKLPLVDEVLALDAENRAAMSEANELRSARNTLSKQVGMLMGQAKKDPSKLEEAEAVKAKVKANADRLAELEKRESELEDEIYTRVNPSWDREKVLLSPVQGLRIVDGVEGIEYGVTFLSGDEPGYWKLGYMIVMHGDIAEAGYHIWISLEEPHQILIYDFSTGEYQRPETLDYEFFQF